MYGEGFSREGCILDMAAECGVVKKSGAWYNYGEDRLGQGREFVKGYLKEHPELRDEIELKVREFYDVPAPGKEGVAASKPNVVATEE
jgi:recombination protein RecA